METDVIPSVTTPAPHPRDQVVWHRRGVPASRAFSPGPMVQPCTCHPSTPGSLLLEANGDCVGPRPTTIAFVWLGALQRSCTCRLPAWSGLTSPTRDRAGPSQQGTDLTGNSYPGLYESLGFKGAFNVLNAFNAACIPIW